MRLSPPRIAALLLILTLVACGGGSTSPGGGGSGSGSPTSTETQDGSGAGAEAYATSLCTAVGDWVDALKSESTTFQDAASNITSPQDIGGVKDALVTYAGDLVADTDALIDEVDALGVPDVANGQELVDGLDAGFQSARDLFAQLEEDAKGLSATDPTAMINSMQEMATRLQAGAKKIQDAFAAIDDSELKRLSETIPACQALQSP